MARLQIHFDSRHVTVDIIVPELMRNAKARGKTAAEYYSNRSLPVLWLLHGGLGNSTDWPRYTQIETFAEEKGIIVVCPTSENGCYTDMAKGIQWETLIMDDLWARVHGMLPTSDKREDNFIAGLSMGGYGALKFALKYPERFSYVGSFSGGVEIPQEFAVGEFRLPQASDIFGDPDKILGSSNDLYWLSENLKSSGAPVPEVYMSCGTKDRLYGVNAKLCDRMKELGYNVTWDESEHDHEWRFWNIQVEKYLDFLPL